MCGYSSYNGVEGECNLVLCVLEDDITHHDAQMHPREQLLPLQRVVGKFNKFDDGPASDLLHLGVAVSASISTLLRRMGASVEAHG